MLAEGAFRIIKIMHFSAFRALLLGESVLCGICQEKFKLAAIRTAVNIDLHGACDQIRQITEDPTGLTELKLFSSDMIHLLITAQTNNVVLHARSSMTILFKLVS